MLNVTLNSARKISFILKPSPSLCQVSQTPGKNGLLPVSKDRLKSFTFTWPSHQSQLDLLAPLLDGCRPKNKQTKIKFTGFTNHEHNYFCYGQSWASILKLRGARFLFSPLFWTPPRESLTPRVFSFCPGKKLICLCGERVFRGSLFLQRGVNSTSHTDSDFYDLNSKICSGPHLNESFYTIIDV